MSLAGAIILILAMANALINFVVQEQIPGQILDRMVGLGLTHAWQFLIVMNVFLLVLGMVMDGFSAILVAVPLVLPFAARFHLQPFHVAVMFLLNLELAFMLPPLGLNLFISSYRFDRPVVSLYRVVLPFAVLVALGLGLVMYVPRISTVLIASDIAKARAEAALTSSPPRDAWQLECVQEDPSNPHACTPAEAALFAAPKSTTAVVEQGNAATRDDDLFRQMMGEAPDAGNPREQSDDDLFRQMLGASSDAGAR